MSVLLADEQDLPVAADDLVALARYVLGQLGVPDDVELSVLLVDRDTMAALNRQHMGEEGPTDVLAFPMDLPGETPDGVPAVLGDVVLCPSVAAAQAPGSLEQELRLLLVHGILHLLGMDHDVPEREREMTALTQRLLTGYAESRRAG